MKVDVAVREQRSVAHVSPGRWYVVATSEAHECLSWILQSGCLEMCQTGAWTRDPVLECSS